MHLNAKRAENEDSYTEKKSNRRAAAQKKVKSQKKCKAGANATTERGQVLIYDIDDTAQTVTVLEVVKRGDAYR